MRYIIIGWILGMVVVLSSYTASLPNSEVVRGKQLIDSLKSELFIPDQVFPHLKNTVLNYDSLAVIGLLHFVCPSELNQGDCAQCHDLEKAGYSNTQFPLGNRGIIDVLIKQRDKDHKVDVQDVRTQKILNTFYHDGHLTGGELGYSSWNANLTPKQRTDFKLGNSGFWNGIGRQHQVAGDAHDTKDVTSMLNTIPAVKPLIRATFGEDELTESMATDAMVFFESNYLGNKTKLQLYYRGMTELTDRFYESFVLFYDNCWSCHNGPDLGGKIQSQAIGNSKFEGYYRISGNKEHYGLIKVPGLVNINDARFKFHNSEDISVYKAILSHQQHWSTEYNHINISRSEIRDICYMLGYGFYDTDLKRYLNI